ncbi:flagellar biosynthesis protein FlhF [Sporanaerobacter sp. PP17-6a]|uniref:flagellar biosynthesis protein FlhF n=1 Tax=Sporanaerobacter sp. PP17-6a TaxID=1891289 RepID=UPI00089FE778|nr:flagellar biosynthesis protein FlhF [Sporanaerobacter sp. PP17-6a]SCL83036.1 Flagella-associated GTP-binding protein [Sporanaerobacter sp. PP17-6a]
MKIKRYIGENTQEVMGKLKKELGPEAVILNTKTIKKGGFLGLFKKSMVEVVAAVDEEEYSFKRQNNRAIRNNNENDNLKSEIVKLQNLVEKMYNNMNKSDEINERLEKYRDVLVSNGVDKLVATSILNSINENVNIEDKDEETLDGIVNYYLYERLGDVEPIEIEEKQKVIFFVGPTGVGKTTTLAKIASKIILEGKHSVGLITADTYRIAAVDQLKVYSEILNIPLKTVYKSQDLNKALEEFKDKNIVLVDTAGRTHKDREQILETKELTDSVDNKEIYLVLSVSTDLKTLLSILKQYSLFRECKIIFTKLDETENYGNILNVKYYFDNPLSYITNGQDVPDNIEVADLKKIAGQLFKEN